MTAKDQAQPSTPANGDSTPNTPPARGSKPTNPDKSPAPATEDKPTVKDDATATGKAATKVEAAVEGKAGADGIAAAEASPDATDVLENAAEPNRRRWRRRAKDSAKLPATRRWDRWYWVVARGLATAAIGVVAILLGTLVLPQFIDTNVSADKRTDDPPAEAGEVPGAPLPSSSPPLGVPTPSGTPTPPTRAQTQPGRPADTLSTWAVGLDRLGIPQVALQAYGYAETVLSRTQPSCQLSWTLLAGIGSIESNHGRHGGSVLQANGVSEPRIVGIQLDGSASEKIPDTDKGALDGDAAFDRAMGAMQFIPSTWAQWKSDADNDGKQDPYDIDDAALSAAYYLCANGRNLSTGTDWWSAVLSYNNLERYANDVYTKADRYGQDSTAR